MSDEMTPMMRQYRQIKSEMPDGVVLFFRLGDFYEMFFEDAKTAAPILDIALTRRNSVPMCGVPFHAVDGYIARLIKAGLKVAVCEQVEDASAAKGIVKREVTRIVTPGTATEDSILESGRHNFLAGVCCAGDVFGLALLDMSTGLFFGEEAGSLQILCDIIRRYAPTECIIPAESMNDMSLRDFLAGSVSGNLTSGEDWTFDYDTARDTMVRHLGVHSLDGFGCEGKRAIVGAAGGVLYYVKEDLRRQTGHIRSFALRMSSEFLLLDEATCGNLDLVPLRGQAAKFTLMGTLDVTKTAMGARMLRDWCWRPLVELRKITERHEAISVLCGNRPLLANLRDSLGHVRDMERLIMRIGSGMTNGRDIVAISESLKSVPSLRGQLEKIEDGLLSGLGGSMFELPELVALIDKAIVDEPPVTVKEGGIIRAGYNAELDELRSIAAKGRTWLAEYQASEQTRTGIKTLKVRHNRVFGYYIEISKGQLGNVPDNYNRKQTLVNAERFITPELKEYETKVFDAQDRAMALEYDLFMNVRQAVVDETARIQSTAGAIGCLDVISSLADRALAMRYTRPVMTEGDVVKIKGGRHPVVEQMSDRERFVPNDTELDCVSNQLIIITGPNMAGKSTYIRQVALIVIMAQMGSFVPADHAEIGVVDRVFTRVGASDDLARGRSTFMVEMQETANILNSATGRSLIVLDEIGRGTSTFDGISIAWAVAEYLHNNESVKAKTLFATHYHELTDLALTMQGVKNYNVQVKEKNDKIVFLRKIVPGGSDKSYGIQVARLAGMPQEVIDRAKEILANLEEGELGETGQPSIAKHRPRKSRDDAAQMDLF